MDELKACDPSAVADSLTEMELGKGLVMIGLDGAHDLTSPTMLGGRSQMVMVYVDGVDQHYARAQEAGAQIVMALQDSPGETGGTRRWTSKDTGGTSPSTSATYPRRNELRRLTDWALSCVAQAVDRR